MDGEMEKLDDILPRRKLILKGSAVLLLMSLFLAIFFNTLFESPWLIVAALLVLGAQTALCLFFFDAHQRSILVERKSIVLNMLYNMLSMIVFCSSFILTAESGSSHEVLFTTLCVYAVWGGLYEIGMDLDSSIHLGKMFCIAAVMCATTIMREQDSFRCAWLILIPTSLGIGMIILQDKFN